jgi:uncharacterized membrane protein
MPTYSILKIVHMAGVVALLGNIIVTGVWKVWADRTGNPEVVAFAQRLVTLTDWVFTFGGACLVAIGGYGMALNAGYDLTATRWLVLAQFFFNASGVIWLAILVPVQIVQARMARQFVAGEAIPPAYLRLSRQWLIWGAVATVLPLLNLYVMIAKP